MAQLKLNGNENGNEKCFYLVSLLSNYIPHEIAHRGSGEYRAPNLPKSITERLVCGFISPSPSEMSITFMPSLFQDARTRNMFYLTSMHFMGPRI